MRLDRRLAAATLALGSLGAVSGCGAFRDGAVRPSVNDCVAAIPVGQRLVGTSARLVKLRRMSLPATQALLGTVGSTELTPTSARTSAAAPSASPDSSAAGGAAAGGAAAGGTAAGGTAAGAATVATSASSPSPTAGRSAPRPCVLVFSGDFSAASLGAAPGLGGAPTGHFVVLVTTTRHPRVLRTVVTATDPVR